MSSDTKAIFFPLALLLLFLPISLLWDWLCYKLNKEVEITIVSETVGSINHLTNVRWMWFVWALCSHWVLYLIHFTVSSLSYCIVWMNVFISAMWLIVREIYNPICSLGFHYASMVSRAVKALKQGWVLLLLNPWASPKSSSLFCDQRSSGTGPLLSSSIFTAWQDKAKLFILTIKEKPNWLFLSSSSSFQLVYNEPWGSF